MIRACPSSSVLGWTTIHAKSGMGQSVMATLVAGAPIAGGGMILGFDVWTVIAAITSALFVSFHIPPGGVGRTVTQFTMVAMTSILAANYIGMELVSPPSLALERVSAAVLALVLQSFLSGFYSLNLGRLMHDAARKKLGLPPASGSIPEPEEE